MTRGEMARARSGLQGLRQTAEEIISAAAAFDYEQLILGPELAPDDAGAYALPQTPEETAAREAAEWAAQDMRFRARWFLKERERYAGIEREMAAYQDAAGVARYAEKARSMAALNASLTGAATVLEAALLSGTVVDGMAQARAKAEAIQAAEAERWHRAAESASAIARYQAEAERLHRLTRSYLRRNLPTPEEIAEHRTRTAHLVRAFLRFVPAEIRSAAERAVSVAALFRWGPRRAAAKFLRSRPGRRLWLAAKQEIRKRWSPHWERFRCYLGRALFLALPDSVLPWSGLLEADAVSRRGPPVPSRACVRFTPAAAVGGAM